VPPIAVAVVGCGYWGPNLVRNFLEDPRVELKYICDKLPARLEAVRRRYPGVRLTTEIEEVLSDKEVVAVAIATPIHTHFALAKQALSQGKHVLVEKPLCTTSDQGRELISLAKERGLKLMVDHTFVYNPAIRRIKEIIDAGELGKILYFNSTRVNLGIFQSDVNVIWDLASHDLAIIDHLLGQSPKTVHAAGACHTNNNKEDIAYITLTFDNNLISNLHVSWLSPVKVRQIMIGGEQKMIVFNDLVITEKVRVYDKGITFEQPLTDQERYNNMVKYRVGGMYAPVLDLSESLSIEIAHFIDCIINDTEPLSNGQAGLRVVELLELTDKSLKTGQSEALLEMGPINV
jgi:predicted dehydrogenase